jgi:hypothetical protein
MELIMNHTCMCRLILAGALLGTFTSFGQTVGKVFLLKGDAVTFTEANPKETKVVQNAPVQSKDIVRTAANANLEIGFLDTTSCKLGPSTELSIEEYRFVRDQQNSAFKANLKKGKATFTTGKMVNDNPENFKITTPTATVGVRGCLFDLEQEETDRLVINVIEVGKTNEPSIFVTALNGVRYEFKAPGRIVIENNKIIEIGPAIVFRPPLNVFPEFPMPVQGVIQNDKPAPHIDKQPIDNPNHPPFYP